VDDPPFSLLSNESKPRIKANALCKEVIRRGLAYQSIEKRRPSKWTMSKAMEWLKTNPIPDKSDLDYLSQKLKSLISHSKQVICINAEHDARIGQQKKRWDDKTPWLRLFLTLTSDDVKEAYLLRFHPLNREEFDAQGTSAQPPSWKQIAAKKFNDVDWIPSTEAIPSLHDDFRHPIECPLTVQPILPDQVSAKISTARALLTSIVTQWERSGSGKAMFLDEDDSEYRSESEVYEFKDGDDRSSYLKHCQNRVYILYWWHVAFECQMLQSARESLRNDSSGDSSHIPRAGSDSGSVSKNTRITLQKRQLEVMESLNSAIYSLGSGLELSETISSLTNEVNSLQMDIDKMQERIDNLEIEEACEDDCRKKAKMKAIIQRIQQKVEERTGKLEQIEKELSEAKTPRALRLQNTHDVHEEIDEYRG
jgi:hypothetical protein